MNNLSDFQEELTILVLGVIACLSMFALETGADQVVSAIGGGLTGYLVRGIKDGSTTKP